MNQDAIKEEVKQFNVLKDQITQLTERQSVIKKHLTDAIDEFGIEDDKGHIILEYEEGQTIMKQRRASKNLDLAAAEIILTKKGIRETCMKMVPTLDEAAIMAAFYNGHLSEEDIDTMFPAKVTYAFLVK
jgi:hypothetical protein